MSPLGSEVPNAWVFVHAETLDEAHNRAIVLIRQQLPLVDPALHDLVLTDEVYSFAPTDSD